jgi:RNA-directed DNA polymerase
MEAFPTHTIRMRTRGNGPVNVGELQRKLSQRATVAPQHRFGDLYALLTHREWLAAAYHHVKTNSGSQTPGVDGVTRRQFEANLAGNLETLRQTLKAGTFTPLPVRRTTIREQKADGRIKDRRLGIPALRDRIVQEGVRMILEPIYEADFSRHSYGFRPNRSTKDAVIYLASRLTRGRSYGWAIEGDIRACFGAPGKARRFQRVQFPPRQESSQLTGNRVLDAWR